MLIVGSIFHAMLNQGGKLNDRIRDENEAGREQSDHDKVANHDSCIGDCLADFITDCLK